MKKFLHSFLLLALLCGVSNLYAQKVLYIVGNNGNPNPMSTSDAAAMDYMIKAGYTVTHFDDDQVPAITFETAQAAIDAYDVLVISSSVSGGKVAPYAWTTKPIIFWEGAALKPYGMAGTQGGYAEATLSVTFGDVATYPILKGLTGTVVTSTVAAGGSLASVTTTSGKALATYPGDATKVAWLMFEKGDALDPAANTATGFPADGLAVATRIFVPHDNNSFTTSTPAAVAMLLSSVDYAIDGKMDKPTYTGTGTSSRDFTAEKIEVYPNPVKNTLNIIANNVNSIAIYNVVGSQVWKSNKGFERGIDVSALQAGIYFINISTGKGITSTKFIKE